MVNLMLYVFHHNKKVKEALPFRFLQVQVCECPLKSEVPRVLACLTLVSVLLLSNTFSLHLLPFQVTFHIRWHKSECSYSVLDFIAYRYLQNEC